MACLKLIILSRYDEENGNDFIVVYSVSQHSTHYSNISSLRKSSQLYKAMMGHQEVIKLLIYINIIRVYQSLVFIVNIPCINTIFIQTLLHDLPATHARDMDSGSTQTADYAVLAL